MDSVTLLWQDALIRLNEPWSQGDRIHRVILESLMTGVCCNERRSQGTRLHLLNLGSQMTRVIICSNEAWRQHLLVERRVVEPSNEPLGPKVTDYSVWVPTCYV